MDGYANAFTAMCVRERIYVRSWKRSRPHVSAALLCIQSFPLHGERQGGKGRAADCHASAYNLKWASAAVETRCLPTVSIKQQLQRPANERVLLADLQVELRSHLSLLGNWQADQFTCIIHTPTLRGVIMVKIMRIINEFLWYITFNDLMLLISLIPF